MIALTRHGPFGRRHRLFCVSHGRDARVFFRAKTHAAFQSFAYARVRESEVLELRSFTALAMGLLRA